MWFVFLSDCPATCMCELCATHDDDGCAVIGLSFKKSYMAGVYMDNQSRYFLWQKWDALEMYCLPLHLISQLQ